MGDLIPDILFSSRKIMRALFRQIFSEYMTVARAKKGLKNLIALAPATGRVIKDGNETVVPVEKILKDDIIRMLPVDKAVGDSVFSGTVNLYGSIDFKATKVGEDSSLQRLIHMVEDAEKNQAPTQRIADKWASFLVPVALLIAIAVYVITGDIVRAVTLSVLGILTPTTGALVHNADSCLVVLLAALQYDRKYK